MRPTSLRCSLAFLASCLLPHLASADDFTLPLQRALAWLEARQAPGDGSWAAASPGATMVQTLAAARALAAAHRRSAAWYAAQAWLENHAATNFDTRASRLAVLRESEANLQSERAALLAGRVAGGWGLGPHYQPSALDTALVLQALSQARTPPTAQDALAIIRNAPATDAWTNARLLAALGPFVARDPLLARALQPALATLSPASLDHAPGALVAAAAIAWQAVVPAAPDGKALRTRLLALQATDGSLDGNVLATSLLAEAYALRLPAGAADDRVVQVPDLALRIAINEALGRNALDALDQGELAQLTSLDLDGRGVRTLEGLQYATNLAQFSAGDSPLQDLTPLAQLPLLAEAATATTRGVAMPPTLVRSVPLFPGTLSRLSALLCVLGVCAAVRQRRTSWNAGRTRFAMFALLIGNAVAAVPAWATSAQPPTTAALIERLAEPLLKARAQRLDDPAARQLLEDTRQVLDELHAAVRGTPRITVLTEAAPTRSAAGASLPPSALPPAATALPGRLRHAAGTHKSTANPDPVRLSLDAARNVAFRRWADEVESALAPDVPDRLARLERLRQRLAPSRLRAPDATHKTPTLQALPAPARRPAP